MTSSTARRSARRAAPGRRFPRRGCETRGSSKAMGRIWRDAMLMAMAPSAKPWLAPDPAHRLRVPRVSHLGEEIFGPVLHVVRFDESVDEVIQDINALGYGLTLGIQTRIDSRASAWPTRRAFATLRNRTSSARWWACSPSRRRPVRYGPQGGAPTTCAASARAAHRTRPAPPLSLDGRSEPLAVGADAGWRDTPLTERIATLRRGRRHAGRAHAIALRSLFTAAQTRWPTRAARPHRQSNTLRHHARASSPCGPRWIVEFARPGRRRQRPAGRNSASGWAATNAPASPAARRPAHQRADAAADSALPGCSPAPNSPASRSLRQTRPRLITLAQAWPAGPAPSCARHRGPATCASSTASRRSRRYSQHGGCGGERGVAGGSALSRSAIRADSRVVDRECDVLHSSTV